MATVCPYCRVPLNIKRAKPGRYAARCRKCGKRFAVVVPENVSEPMVTVPLGSQAAPGAGRVSGQASKAPLRGAVADQQKTVPLPSEEAPAQTERRPSGTKGSLAEEPTLPAAREPRPERATVASASVYGDFVVPERLGGYEILEELGRGGMGIVFLARQLSLDRDVALKVISPQWASNEMFLARFTREAYAAAHLVHHNVVQIYDMGVDKNVYYFSMEYVPGHTLGRLIEREGRLDPEVASGYVLQAARGLTFAHENGMIHRDIKPDNLMLNDIGIVKVADLGLVKTPGSERQGPAGQSTLPGVSQGRIELTGVGVTMGSPAYMAPEQAQDAASVDARADIYSLGCTFYALVTGRPVFEGRTAKEIITKHSTAPIVPPETIVKRLSRGLSAVITRMVAKKPEDRYQNMGQVVKALEHFLGIDSVGPITPREEEALLLEESTKRYNSSSPAKIRLGMVWTFGLLCPLLAILFSVLGHPFLAGGVVGLGVLSWLCYFVITGITQKTYLFVKFRQLVLTNSPVDWLIWLFWAALGILLLWSFNLLWVWFAFFAGAAALAAGFCLVVDRLVAKDRKGSLEAVAYMLKKMRLRGLDEQSVRQFVCKYSGEEWELLYEGLFGYEAKIEARKLWGVGEQGRMRKKSAVWRDALIEWMDAKLKSRKEVKDKKHLEAVEARALEAKGVGETQARQEAKRTAEELVAQEVVVQGLTAPGDRAARALGTGGGRARRTIARRQHLDLLLGARVRFVLGAILVVACALWMNQNGMIRGSEIKQAIGAQRSRMRRALAERGMTWVTGEVEEGDESGLPGAQSGEESPEESVGPAEHETTPLKIPLVPQSIRSRFFNSFSAVIAGLILVMSIFFMVWRMGLLIIPASAIVLLAPALGVPSVGPLNTRFVSLAVAGLLVAIALLFCRERERGGQS